SPHSVAPGKAVDGWRDRAAARNGEDRRMRRKQVHDMTAFEGWENFYVIVGSSAGALIGLQFVVITLIADLPIARDGGQAGDAFATPSVVHFGAVLLLSANVSAPGNGIGAVAA